jgi:hypothetical protein
MARKRTRSAPSVRTASSDLFDALSDLITSSGRWLALQPAAQEVPVQAARVRRASSESLGHAGNWADATATQARQRGAALASSTRTQLINLALLVGILWWLDRTLRAEED